MRVKLIALVVAGLFAQSASADDNFLWGGSLEAGYRGTNIDGANRNGAYGNTNVMGPTNPPTPFTGPEDDAKVQEYQNVKSDPIGVIDLRGSSRTSYFRAFGEEFGRDDQFINLVGGSYGVWKGSVYNNDIPHNFSYNALSPLTGANGQLLQVGPGGTYPNAQNPAIWYPYNLSTQRNTLGANAEFSNKTPWYIRADFNEVKQTGVKPSSAQLGTGSGNGWIDLGAPVDYKTLNATVEGGYSGKQYGFKLSFLNSRFSDANDAFQWTNFYMRSTLDTTLLPENNDLKKWAFNGYIKQLPWDSAILLRATQSKQESNVNIVGSGLKPGGTVASGQYMPPNPGYLFAQPYDLGTNSNLSTFNGVIKTNTVNVAWNASPMAQLDTRVYYNYYDRANDSTAVSYRAAWQGSACPAAPTGSSANCFYLAGLTEEDGEQFGYRKNAAGFDASWAFDRTNKLLGGFDWESIDRNLEDAPKSDDYRYWIEYRNTGWNNLSGRLKYEFLQRKSDLVNTANPATSVAAFFTAYDVNNFDSNVVRLNLDWTPSPMWFVGFGAQWRDRDYKDNYYGRTKDKYQQYDVTVSWGSADKLKITGIGNYNKIEYEQAYRNVGSATSTPPTLTGTRPSDPQNSVNYNWGSTNTQDGWMLAAMADWAASDKLMVTTSYSYQKTGGGVDFWSGNTQLGGGFNGGPLVNYTDDDTKLQIFQIKANYNHNKNWAFTLGYAWEKYDYSDAQMAGWGGYYPYFGNTNTANAATSGALNSSFTWGGGAFANPSYTTNIVWVSATYKFDPPPQVYVPPKVAEAPKPAAPPPPPPPPPPAPAKPAPVVQKITLDSKVLFDFDKAVLKPEGKAALDSAVVGKLNTIQKLEVVLVTGHTDPIGTDAYNQKLSERRADAVRDYLVSKGVPKDKIEAIGMGEKQPVIGEKECNQKNLKDKIACLQPDRRVEVQAKGEATK